MARELEVFDRSRIAASDLSGSQYAAVCLDTTAGGCKVDLPTNLSLSDGCRIYGILQNKPTAGQVAEVRCIGLSKFLVDAGAGVTAGDALMVDTTTGGAITASGAVMVVGWAEETAAASTYVTATVFAPGSPLT